MHFYNKFLSLCSQKSVAPSRAAIEMGINKGTVSVWKSKYKKGEQVTPSSPIITKMTEYFGVDINFLMGYNEQKENRKEVHMNEIQIFSNPNFGTIRTIDENDKPLFCSSDVAKALGYAKPQNAIDMHCRCALKRGIPHPQSPTKTIEMSFIPEADVYRLVFSSKLPNAEKFTDWVTEEVLPSIRKHGAYMTPETLEAAILNPDTMIKLCTALKDEQKKSRVLEATNSVLTVDKQIMQPKADYFDELVDRNLLTNFRETANQLGIKQQEFVNFLLEHKYIYHDKKRKLMPYSDKNNGLFEIKECYNEKTKWSGTQTLITPKGRETFKLLCV